MIRGLRRAAWFALLLVIVVPCGLFFLGTVWVLFCDQTGLTGAETPGLLVIAVALVVVVWWALRGDWQREDAELDDAEVLPRGDRLDRRAQT